MEAVTTSNIVNLEVRMLLSTIIFMFLFGNDEFGYAKVINPFIGLCIYIFIKASDKDKQCSKFFKKIVELRGFRKYNNYHV